MKIGLITDSIREQSTGIGYYATDVIREVRNLGKENDYTYLDFLETRFNKEKFIKLNNPFPYFKTYNWHNYIPLITRKLDLDYIFNFSAVPHIIPFRQKEIFFVYDISWYLYPEYHPKSRVLFYKFLFKSSLNNSFKIVVDSVSNKNDLVNIFNTSAKKITVVYPPFTDKLKEIKNIQYEINYPFILFIGTMEPRKNITSIIKAFKQLKNKKNISEKLIICGKKGWLYEEIFELIKKLNLSEDIIYLGYITDEEKKWLYKHAKFFVYPSWYEGFGIPVFEAMTYGCPVITSNISSLPEVIGDAGISVKPDSVNALSEAMDHLISNKEKRKNMKKDGFKQVKKLSNINQIKQLLDSLK